LSSSLSGGYLWSNGATTKSITVSASGSYTVRSYNAGGCFSTSLPTTITVIMARESNGNATTGISNEENQIQYSLYPNPMHDQLNIAFNLSDSKKVTV